jgi:hypothetical protein
MFYIYTIFVPALILLIGYYLSNPKRKGKSGYIDLIIKRLPYFFLYSFLLYFLEMESYINSGWAFYTILFFLIPVTLIVLLLKMYYWNMKRRRK